MSDLFLRFSGVTFVYESATEALFVDTSIHLGSGWCGIVGANGTGKTTLLKLASGLLQPHQGHVEAPARRWYCPQRTDEPPEGLDDLLTTATKTAYRMRQKLGLGEDWRIRWATLSHGERKRAQIAAALWQEPDLLAIDEPTNHVDAEAREIISRALREYKGIGLLVSHDRELLDSLCSCCLFTEPPGIIVRPGNFTESQRVTESEEDAIRKRRLEMKRTLTRLSSEGARRAEQARRSDKRRSKKGLAKHDHDAREKIDRVRVSGKDGTGGAIHRQLQGRLARLAQELRSIPTRKEQRLGIWLDGCFSKKDRLVQLQAGAIRLGSSKRLVFPELTVGPTDRIAITGPNGSGKSTLLAHMIELLRTEPEHVTYVPQEIDAERSSVIMSQVRRLSKNRRGYLMTIVSRLGSQPDRLLVSDEPSPGETRKLLLALGMTRQPHLIVMDEPTNHMDLPSIRCLEEALSDCPCSLVLISHDRPFLRKLTAIEWRIRVEATCNRVRVGPLQDP